MMWRELFTLAVYGRSGASKQLAPHSLHLFLKDHKSVCGMIWRQTDFRLTDYSSLLAVIFECSKSD